MPEFPGIPWEALEEDIHIVKNNPVLSVEELAQNTFYPRFDLINPQRKWRTQLSDLGDFRITDILAAKTRARIIHDISSGSASQFQLYNSDGTLIFDIDYDGCHKTDLKVRRSNPSLIVEETASATYYPRLDLKNPQRTWRLQGDADGRFRIVDATAGLVRFLIDADGKLSSIASIAQTLLPDGDLTRSLGSSTLRWLLNGWNPDAHASRHEYGGADMIHNLDYLAIRGYTIIDTARQLQNISAIIQDITISKANPYFGLNETTSATTYPRFDLINPQRRWRIFNTTDGSLNIFDVTAAVYRLRLFYSTAAGSEQFRLVNSAGTTVMSIDYEGDVTIPGKLTQGACPEFSKMTLAEIKEFLVKARDKTEPKKDGNGRILCDVCGKPLCEDGCMDAEHFKITVDNHYHKTQEEVMALIHLTLNLLERVERLEAKIGA